jgi:hypothetical protein
MTLFTKLWDFLLGVAAIAAAPTIPFFVVGFGLERLARAVFGDPAPNDTRFVAMGIGISAIAAAAALASLFFVCRWRIKRRLLPSVVFAVELLLGLALSGIYTLIVCGILAMSDPNW